MSLSLSVVIVAERDSPTLIRALGKLRMQTAAPELECILVTASRAKVIQALRELEGRLPCQLVEMDSLNSEGAAKAAGVAAARAPLVAFMEDHSYPETGWAEAMIRAHQQENYAAVGPIILNANPNTAASWGCFLVYYSSCMWQRPQEEIRQLAANQSCYLREVLMSYGSRLPDMLQAECVLHADLLSKGFRLLQVPEARVYHLNYSRLWPALCEYYLASRVFAAERSAGWERVRRIVFFSRLPTSVADSPTQNSSGCAPSEA